MNNYIILFEDNEDFAHKRQEYMQNHLSFLEKNSNQIVAAGPLSDEQDDTPAGGIWTVSAASQDEVDALVKADPFWPTGLRHSYRILKWKQVYRDGKRQK